MHPNHQFLVDFILDAAPGAPDFQALDFGCGRGETVVAAREAGVDAYGVDTFTFGGMAEAVRSLDLPAGSIVAMDDDTIPFADESFDVVVNNQVLEHVPSLDTTLKEIARVLKPGGCALSIFPAKDVIRENHCGIPMIHWFPRGSRARFYYGLGMAYAGFGYRDPSEDRATWLDHFLQRMDHRTFYRPRREILASFGQRFATTQFAEHRYIDFRLALTPAFQPLRPLASHRLSRPLAQELYRRLGSLVLVSTKAGATVPG